MAVTRGNMNGSNNINNSGTFAGQFSNNGLGFGGYSGYGYFIPEMIFEYNRGNNVDLTNLNVGDFVTAGQLTVDTTPTYEEISEGTTAANGTTTRAQVRISFSANLNYTITSDEQLNLLFRLFRQDSCGRRIELTSVPYIISFTGNLTNETELLTAQLQKSETFYTEYFDQVRGGGMFTYIMEVGLTYSSIDLATISGGYISATGTIDNGCVR